MKQQQKAFWTTSILMTGIGILYLFLGTFGNTTLSSSQFADLRWLAISVALILAGILGVMFHKKSEKMQICFLVGIAIFIPMAANIIWDVYTGQSAFWMLLAIGLPLIYTLEAHKLKD